MAEKNYFEELNAINVNEKTEKKGNLTYLSWAWAWGELKKRHPDATYCIYENNQGWNYHTDGKTAWVKTGVTVNGIENIEYLPVMDFRNNSIPIEKVTSTDVNKTIQRSLTKAVARHGLGLYIYAGEDLPEDNTEDIPKAVTSPPQRKNRKKEEPEKTEEQGDNFAKATDIITFAHAQAVRKRLKAAAEKGKVLEEADLCKQLGINTLEDMNYGQLNWFMDLMTKNGV